MSYPKICISYASEDEFIVKSFNNKILKLGLEIKSTDIFAYSVVGHGIKTGEDWRKAIKDNLLNSKVIFLFLTPYYKESEICLNEMGAAWMTDSRVIPLTIYPILFDTIGVIGETLQVTILNDKNKLDEIRDTLYNEGLTDNNSTANWNVNRREFISLLKNYITENPFPDALNRERFDEISSNLKDAEEDFDKIVIEKEKLENEINKIRKLKDKEDLLEMDRELGKISPLEHFEDLAKQVSTCLSEFDSSIRTLIYNDYTNNNLEISSYYKGEIKEAIARGYLDSNNDVIQSTNEMSKSYEALRNLSEFMSENEENESLIEAFNETFKVPFDLNNLKFWEEVFKYSLTCD